MSKLPIPSLDTRGWLTLGRMVLKTLVYTGFMPFFLVGMIPATAWAIPWRGIFARACNFCGMAGYDVAIFELLTSSDNG